MSNEIVCYYWGKENDWEGLCTTFDIAMHGTTLEETEKCLEEAIEAFLEEVEKLPKLDRNRLLKRRSPWHLRLSLKVVSLICRIGRKPGNKDFAFPGLKSIPYPNIGIVSKKSIIDALNEI
ncbi:MAG: hypothetical protein OXD45_06770 [Rhodobacteraceae bacterium]|nr:hypothetical protein [Paracoccaceae bacterium]